MLLLILLLLDLHFEILLHDAPTIHTALQVQQQQQHLLLVLLLVPPPLLALPPLLQFLGWLLLLLLLLYLMGLVSHATGLKAHNQLVGTAQQPTAC